MDSLITAAARALATSDALGALKRTALRDDPPALALRGIATAQLGEYPAYTPAMWPHPCCSGPGFLRVAMAPRFW